MKNDELVFMVREILLREWDPCGVDGNDALKDEYDEYMPEILALMAQRSSSATLNETLIGFEQELGVRLPEQQRERVVRALLGIRI
jgi:hypothetical protein